MRKIESGAGRATTAAFPRIISRIYLCARANFVNNIKIFIRSDNPQPSWHFPLLTIFWKL